MIYRSINNVFHSFYLLCQLWPGINLLPLCCYAQILSHSMVIIDTHSNTELQMFIFSSIALCQLYPQCCNAYNNCKPYNNEEFCIIIIGRSILEALIYSFCDVKKCHQTPNQNFHVFSQGLSELKESISSCPCLSTSCFSLRRNSQNFFSSASVAVPRFILSNISPSSFFISGRS